MPLTAGTRLGPYRITAPIGAGGMGEVYRATDTTLDRDVAIKVLPDAFASDPERLARFEREAKVLASLNHPNIAAIHGLERSGDTPALVLELVEGPTLADRIATGPIPLDEALPIAKQIAEALEAAHEAGIIHRDLKPANIKVTPEGIVKVLDFGLAKALEPEVSEADAANSPTMTAAATKMGVLMGTAAYMSPEQARGKPVDRRADIWAFGVVLYEMLTGRMAFKGEDITDTIAALVRDDPDWSVLPSRTPVSVRRLLRRTFMKEPKRRLRHIGDALLELTDVEEGADRSGASDAVLRADSAPGAVKRFTLSISGERLRSAERATTSASSESILLALTPDGSKLAYVSEGGINLRPFAKTEAYRVPGTEGGKTPFFSPDGRRLGFVGPAGDLKVLDLATGLPETVAEGVSPVGASWAADDSIVFGVFQGPLRRVSSEGGDARPVFQDSTLDLFGWYWPDVLPTGRGVLFSGVPGPLSTENQIAVLAFDTGTVRVLADGNFPRYSPTGHVVFSRTSELWAVPFDVDRLEVTGAPARIVKGISRSLFSGLTQFALAHDGTLVYLPKMAQAPERRLVWLGADGPTVPVTDTLAAYQHPRLSPDGTRVAVSVSEDTGAEQIWVLDLRRGSRTRITVDGSVNRWPVWSPDGQRLAFCSTRGDATFSLFQKSADGSGEVELLLSATDVGGEYAIPTSWSRENGMLAFYLGTPAGPRNLWLLGPDNTPHEILATPCDDRAPSVSPEGEWLAYVSDESGQDEVYVLPVVGGGARITVSSNGGTEPVWARDGTRLFYRHGEDLMAVGFDPDSRSFGAPEVVIEGRPDLLPTPQGNPNYDVSADLEQFLMVQRIEDARPVEIQIVLNFFEELKLRVPTGQ